jgi:flavin reductase (DIM6/NTAB) family NADH-FMN oxidoreductase RutF
MHQALATASHFIVNVLAADQEALSRRFAELEDNRFDGVGFRTGKLGLPILDGVLAHIECSKHSAVEAGDHTVYVGLVTGGSVTDGRPLLYYRGGYANLSGS